MSFSKEELFQCICECMAESLPNSWESAYMQATIKGNEIDAKYRYTNTSSTQELTFQPENVIAPMNAAKELKTLMDKEGNDWNTVTIKISSDGNFEVYTQ